LALGGGMFVRFRSALLGAGCPHPRPLSLGRGESFFGGPTRGLRFAAPPATFDDPSGVLGRGPFWVRSLERRRDSLLVPSETLFKSGGTLMGRLVRVGRRATITGL